MDKVDEFHTHLDICKQCRENPFGLCSLGERLLLRAVVMPVMGSGITPDQADLCDCGEPFPKNGYCKFCGTRRREPLI